MPIRRKSPLLRALSPLRDFLHTEAAGGALLVVAAVAAMVWANSPWSGAYDSLWQSKASIGIAGHRLELDLRHWVNDGLMAVFFLVVGLEIKREVTTGHLAGRRAAALPVAAALGGMVVPAGLYLLIAGGTAARGWGVPMATDIALAVGVLALAGSSVPAKLRAFLLGLAVVDDIGAIVVIAVFYSSGVTFGWLAAAVLAVAAALLIHRLGVHHVLVFTVIGAAVWFFLHEAGVHPTLAGVVMGLLAPVTPRLTADLVDVDELNDLSSAENARLSSQIARDTISTVEWLEHVLHPWTSFLIVPVFALANAGIEVSTGSLKSAWHSPVAWGVLAGLMAGKPLGVLLASRLAVRSGVAEPLEGTSSRQLLGAGNAAGIGFTVALFVAELAFRSGNPATDAAHVSAAKMAILVASLLSGMIAFALLRRRRGAAPAETRLTRG
ncbi:MAG: Na+/H+ antiporter NhaA [Actinomycetota bacterium]|nr:Na+/H+ antiporter NhaA [Actinomycetota bacterium]